MSLTVAPAWGSASSGVERLWSLSSARELARDGESEAGQRLEAEVGYGLGLTAARGVVTPYTGLSLRDWRQPHVPHGRTLDPGSRHRSAARGRSRSRTWRRRTGPLRRTARRGALVARARDFNDSGRWHPRKPSTVRGPAPASRNEHRDGSPHQGPQVGLAEGLSPTPNWIASGLDIRRRGECGRSRRVLFSPRLRTPSACGRLRPGFRVEPSSPHG